MASLAYAIGCLPFVIEAVPSPLSVLKPSENPTLVHGDSSERTEAGQLARRALRKLRIWGELRNHCGASEATARAIEARGTTTSPVRSQCDAGRVDDDRSAHRLPSLA
jgi:hypothetical protein